MRRVFTPLSEWPWPETKHRRRSAFRGTYGSTLALLDTEAHMLKRVGTSSTHTFDIAVDVHPSEIRRESALRASARPLTPRVAVHLRNTIHGELVFHADTFLDWRDNIRAIALTMQALRKMTRYGVGFGHEQYAGFRRELGAATTMSWAVTTLAERSGLEQPSAVTREWVVAAFRAGVQRCHPDCGGSADEFRELWQARDHALREVGG